MKAEKLLASYRQLRNDALWRLMAADTGPTIIAILQATLYEQERVLPASVFHERVERLLDQLRAQGESWQPAAQKYAADWLAAGYLVRSLPPGEREEIYELSTPTISAIRFLSTLSAPHRAATESRLHLVINALARLAGDTDPDTGRRIARLRQEQQRIADDIAALEGGHAPTLAPAVALERAREAIALADGLAGDFRHVRDRFEQLHRDLRERLMDSEGNRGEVLGDMFSGIDLIAESDAGRSFAAFWRLLTDPLQSATLDAALDQLLERDFARQLGASERRFLTRLTRTLLEQGGAVHEVLQAFARSLKQFVQSREYLAQRRINELLREAQRAALPLKEHLHPIAPLPFHLELSTSQLRSLSQWQLYDPAQQAAPAPMAEGAVAAISLEAVGELMAQSEIHFRRLQEHIDDVLADQSQASIGQVLDRHPAEQGLGSVLGLMALGSRHGLAGQGQETVAWTGGDGVRRQATIPVLYFLRESANATS